MKKTTRTPRPRPEDSFLKTAFPERPILHGTFVSTDLPSLKSELLNDPTGIGYAVHISSGDHTKVAEVINQPRAGITVRRGIRAGIEVMRCIALGEFEPLSVGRQQYIIALVTPVEGVDLSDQVVRDSLVAIFPPASTSLPRLAAIADKTPASRAEQLYGVDTVLGFNHISQALMS